MASTRAMSGNNRTLLLIALIAGLLAAVLVYVAISGGSDDSPAAAPPAAATTRSVVVAAQDIAPGALITEEMVAAREVPVELALTGAFTQPDLVVGQRAGQAIFSGEQISRAKVGAGIRGEGLEYVVPDGMRALSLRITQLTGVGGHLLPGNRVDVMAIFVREDQPDLVMPILQDIEVLAVQQEAQLPAVAPAEPAAGEGEGEGGTDLPAGRTSGQQPEELEIQPGAAHVTLALLPSDALYLALVQHQADQVWLALRPFGEEGEQELPILQIVLPQPDPVTVEPPQ